MCALICLLTGISESVTADACSDSQHLSLGYLALAAFAKKRRAHFQSKQDAARRFRSRPPFSAFHKSCFEQYLEHGLVEQLGRACKCRHMLSLYIMLTFPRSGLTVLVVAEYQACMRIVHKGLLCSQQSAAHHAKVYAQVLQLEDWHASIQHAQPMCLHMATHHLLHSHISLWDQHTER